MLCLGLIGMNSVISELCCKRDSILQRTYRKMTIYGHFPISLCKMGAAT